MNTKEDSLFMYSFPYHVKYRHLTFKLVFQENYFVIIYNREHLASVVFFCYVPSLGTNFYFCMIFSVSFTDNSSFILFIFFNYPTFFHPL